MSLSLQQNSKVLIADDDESVRALLRNLLEHEGHEVVEAVDGLDAIAKLTDDTQVAIIDNSMPRLTGLECLTQIKGSGRQTEVIMLSVGGINDAVLAMQKGAFWYIQKPFQPEELNALIQKAFEHGRLKVQSEELRDALDAASVGSLSMATNLLPVEIAQRLQKIANLDCSILITGETGTGKSTLARWIHQNSPRKSGPFTAVSCAALPRDLLEAELFGFERGAFTGAVKAKPGRIELADKGVLFMDEIGDLALELQPKILTFLEDHTVHPLGGGRSKKIDVRLIAATLQNLQQLCQERKFREDLFFRLNVINLHMQPLRERINDIELIANSLLYRIGHRYGLSQSSLSSCALSAISAHDWPGNIRELEHCLERALLLTSSSTISADDLDLPSSKNKSHPKSSSAGKTLQEIEFQAIVDTLQLCGGNKRKAARKLGISEKSIYNKLNRTPTSR